MPLFGALSLEDNISNDYPEILPVGTEGMLQIGLEITTLAVLDLVQSLGHVHIKRRQKARLGLNPQFLQLFGIEIEILLAQGPDAHNLHLSLQHIDEHRQLIEPGLAQESPPLRDAVIVAEFAAHIQVVVLVDVGLQVFGIGIHRAELEHIEFLPVLAHTAQLHQGTIGVRLVMRCTLLLPDDTIAVMDVLLADDLEAAIIQPAQDLGTREDLPHLLRTKIVETTRQPEFWAHPMPQEIKEIDDTRKKPGMFAENLGTVFLGRIEATDQITVLLQLGVGLAEVTVHVTDGVEMVFRQQYLGLTIGHLPRLFRIVIEPCRALGTTRRLGHGNQLAQLFGGIVKFKPGGMLGLGDGKVFHDLVVVVA